jgi:hypothetical protein
MQTRRISGLLWILCLAPAAVITAQNQTLSVWDRVQKVEDPDLGELIRAALENRRNISQRETQDIIRKVTLGYTQIRLLDRQIEQVSHKLTSSRGPADMRYELLLARAELESKLMKELADLREVMGIIPKYPFDEQPVEGLKTRIHLNPIDDDRVHVIEIADPTFEYWAMMEYKSLGLMSQNDVRDLIRRRLQNPSNRPVRVDILWRNKAAAELRDGVVRTIKEVGAEMHADVRIERNAFIGSGESPYFLRQGRITTFYPAPVRRPGQPSTKVLVNGFVDPQELDGHLQWRIGFQWNIPLTFWIEYDKASSDVAQRVASEVKSVADRLGVAGLVEVKSVLVDPVPDTVFLGRWESMGKGEIQAIDIHLNGEGTIILGEGSQLGKTGETIRCPWWLTTKEIVLDPGKVVGAGHRYMFRAHVDESGNLAAFRGMFYPQGSFHLAQAQPTVLKKMD